MAIELDQLFYDALMADADLVASVGGRIDSTCFEVSPEDQDNTPLPCIIVTDDGLTNDMSTKDDVWESGNDLVQASVEVDAVDPKQVKAIIRMVRKAIANHISPYIDYSIASNGVATKDKVGDTPVRYIGIGHFGYLAEQQHGELRFNIDGTSSANFDRGTVAIGMSTDYSLTELSGKVNGGDGTPQAFALIKLVEPETTTTETTTTE